MPHIAAYKKSEGPAQKQGFPSDLQQLLYFYNTLDRKLMVR